VVGGRFSVVGVLFSAVAVCPQTTGLSPQI
jgi:hypothetical protein